MLALVKARLAQPPARTLPTRMEDPWYDADHQVRRVRWNGMIKWRGEEICIGEALAGELIGLAEHESGATSRASAIAISGSSIATAVSCALLRWCAAPRRFGNGSDIATLRWDSVRDQPGPRCQDSARSDRQI